MYAERYDSGRRTVAFMHSSSRRRRDRGTGCSRTLIQLPPEALAGLSADELAEIRNLRSG